LTIASRLLRIALSTVSSNSRYEHIRLSIWLISRLYVLAAEAIVDRNNMGSAMQSVEAKR
jgi:hypothetical protein